MHAIDIFRVDKNVAHNIDHISLYASGTDMVSVDSGLVKSLLHEFSHSYQKNLFGFGELDPYKFAKKFNYSMGFLRSKHPNPIQLKGLLKNEITNLYALQEEDPATYRIFDSYLENALYMLNKVAITFVRGAKFVDITNDQVNYKTSLKSYILIKELEVNFTRSVNNRGSDKVVYTYELDRLFLNNLSHYYLKSDLNSIVALKRFSLDDLYLYLNNLRDTLKVKGENRTETLDFGFLCKLAHINEIQQDGNEYPTRFRKRDLNQKLKKLMDNSDLDFSYRWAKGPGHRFAYSPVITFNNIDFNVPADQKFREKYNIFLQNCLRHLVSAYKMLRPMEYSTNDRELYFNKWMRNTSVDVKEKWHSYDTAYMETYADLKKSTEGRKIKFFNDIITANDLSEFFLGKTA